MSKVGKFIWTIIICLGIICFVTFLYIASIIYTTDTISLDTAMLNSYNAKLTFYDTNNNELIKTSSSGQDAISLDDLSKNTINSFLAIEDKKFYHHNGLDYGRIVKASIKNLLSGKAVEGASTITQQLIKNTHLTSEKTLDRKIKEAYLAVQLEKAYTKDEILTTYLNVLYFGNNLYGIQDASLAYFGHNASELTLAESATLAGLIKSPARYSPVKNPSKSKIRRNLVLKMMLNQNKINQTEYDEAINTDISIQQNNLQTETMYYKMAVNEAMKVLNFSENDINTSGLKIYTYLNNNIQKEVNSAHSNLSNKLKSANDIIMVVDNQNNSVLAFAGNCEDIYRQCGSIIKPILCYGSAFENNILSPASPILDEKISGNGYSPDNVGGKTYGWVSTRKALSQSLNIPAVKVLEYVGIEKAKNFARNFGIDFSSDDNHLALALGAMSKGTTIQQITDAYATFANNGKYSASKFIEHIEDQSGKILYKRTDINKATACREDTAYLITSILQDCSKSGTAKKIGSLNLNVASKTGTVGTSEKGNTDAWCVSYSPNITITSWCGNTTGDSAFNLPNSQNGGTVCANANYSVLKNIVKYKNFPQFEIPNTIQTLKINKNILETEHKVYLAENSQNTSTEIFSTFNLPSKNPNIEMTPSATTITYDENSQCIKWKNDENLNYKIIQENFENKTTETKNFTTTNNENFYKLDKSKVKKIYLLIENKEHNTTESNKIEFYQLKKGEKTLNKRMAKVWFG